MNDTEINFKNENEYLELMNELKNKYDKFQEDKDELEKKIKDIYKFIFCIYGLIRMLDEFIDNFLDANKFISDLVASTRTLLSNKIDEILFDEINL